MITPILIVLVGLLLIGIEVYLIPGSNVIGVVGLLAIFIALGIVFSTYGLAGGMTGVLITLLGGAGMFYLMWQSGAWDRFVLETTLKPDAAQLVSEQEERGQVLGLTGRAITPLRPSGVIEIDGKRIEVTTEGGFVAAGSEVKVVAINRRQYFVRMIDALPEPSSTDDSVDEPNEIA